MRRRSDVEDALAQLRRLLSRIEADELEATRAQRAHLEGAAEALEWVLGVRIVRPGQDD